MRRKKMNWLIQTLWSSIGKKLMMALTGLAFTVFLMAHLAGNLTIYGGREAFNAYAEKLHSLGPLLTVFELGLLLFAGVHIITGIFLFFQNRQARPSGYLRYESSGGRTLSSRTMPYTGLIILGFVVFHLINFSFVDKADRTIFQIVSSAFANPVYVAIYIVVMIVVALHVRHGLWSAFQTLGGNHPKYMPAIMLLSIVIGLIVAVGFGFLPIYLALSV
jgi:succinate dehydrogenase / fumarate reductase cytochrome b subunit